MGVFYLSPVVDNLLESKGGKQAFHTPGKVDNSGDECCHQISGVSELEIPTWVKNPSSSEGNKMRLS